MTLSAKSSLILGENKAVFCVCRESHKCRQLTVVYLLDILYIATRRLVIIYVHLVFFLVYILKRMVGILVAT